MSVFCKPGNYVFEIAPDKLEDFLNASKGGSLDKALKAIDDRVAMIKKMRKEKEKKKK
ncbi:MAG: hypothetical protein LBQ96_05530 [Fusobacteriaceae bacterium]|jgi:hypothetical protein|nr:hypothetical protein [Fusobacteriaceae bacterium]